MDITYRLIQKGEEAQAALIESVSLDTAWSPSQIENIPENAFYFVAVQGTKLVGCASVYLVVGEGQIMNIAVDPKERKKGIGKDLMDFLESYLKSKDCQSISLEVSVENVGAMALYQKCGYVEVGRRKGFYKGVDAIIMEKIL